MCIKLSWNWLRFWAFLASLEKTKLSLFKEKQKKVATDINEKINLRNGLFWFIFESFNGTKRPPELNPCQLFFFYSWKSVFYFLNFSFELAILLFLNISPDFSFEKKNVLFSWIFFFLQCKLKSLLNYTYWKAQRKVTSTSLVTKLRKLTSVIFFAQK